jgi:hypothetical protein
MTSNDLKAFYEAEINAISFVDEDGMINFAVEVTVYSGNSLLRLRAKQFFKKGENFWNIGRQMMKKAGFAVQEKTADFFNHNLVSGGIVKRERRDGETPETYLDRTWNRQNAHTVCVSI